MKKIYKLTHDQIIRLACLGLAVDRDIEGPEWVVIAEASANGEELIVTFTDEGEPAAPPPGTVWN